MRLLKMARDLISISEFLRDKYGIYYEEGELYDFDQTWGSTALGFGGCGGQMITTERTYVFTPRSIDDIAYVFFGDRFAYETQINDKFWADIKNRQMASVMESGRYST